MKFISLAVMTTVLSLVGLSLAQAAEPIKAFASHTKGANVTDNSLDNNLATRWVGKGDGVFIQYKFEEAVTLSAINIAFHKGDKRATTFQIESTDTPWKADPNWQSQEVMISDASTLELQTYELAEPVTAQYFRVVGFGSEGQWGWKSELTSITEIEFVDAIDDIPFTQICDISASIEHVKHVAENAIDDNLSTRWSGLGAGSTLTLSLCSEIDISGIKAAWLFGDENTNNFKIEVSSDNEVWTQALAQTTSSGDSIEFQYFPFLETLSAKYVRYTGYGNADSTWNSITEFSVCQFDECGEPIIDEPSPWDNVQLYGHAYNINDFSEEEYEFIKNNNEFFTIEKRHAREVYGDVSSERASAATATKIVANNPNAKPLFYWNTAVVYDNVYETIAAVIAEHPEWKNEESGKWTYEDEVFRTWFVDVVKDQVNNEDHVGVFLDAAMSVNYFISSDAKDYLLDMMDEMPGIVIYNGFAPNAVITAGLDFLEHADGVFVEHFFRAHSNTFLKGKQMIDELLLVPNDKIIIANAQPSDFWESTDHSFSLAAFLIVANENSYYHYFSQENYSQDYMTYWDEDFEQDLGEPTGPATVVDDYTYTREFAHASVTLDLLNKASSIVWHNKAVSTSFTDNTFTVEDAAEQVNYNLNLSDYLTIPSASGVEFSIDNAPQWLSLNDNKLSGTPNDDDLGDYTWTVTLNSGGNTDTATFNLSVNSTEAAQVIALGELTTAPTIYDVNGEPTTIQTGDIQSIYFQGLDYQGEETRVYAHVGVPSGIDTPMPAVVLVHGGGGTAFLDWVEKWNDRGYAAISIAVEGQTSESDPNGGYIEHQWAGPYRTGIYNDSDKTLTDQWIYHAVADSILANSLMTSLDSVDPDKVGIMGISWGGVITSTVIGIDNRFAFAIPTYGCGDLADQDNHYGTNLWNNELYLNVWDPMVRMHKVTTPSLWLSWSGDLHFALDSCANTYLASASEHMVTFIPDMLHGHGAGWRPNDSYDFADSIINTGVEWFSQKTLTQSDDNVEMTFTSTKAIESYSLRYATGTGFTGKLEWNDQTATLVEESSGVWKLSATLPENTTGWYFSVTNGDVYASSDYRENITLTLTPAEELLIIVNDSEKIGSAPVELDFTGPSKIEITAIEIMESSHPQAFSIDNSGPLIISDPDAPAAITVSFDNILGDLTANDTASATLKVSWELLDDSIESISLPISVTVEE